MAKLLISVIAFITVFGLATALKCYSCTNCKGSDKDKLPTTMCPENHECSNYNITFKGFNVIAQGRGCSPLEVNCEQVINNERSKLAVQYPEIVNAEPQVKYCEFCKGELCNSSSPIVPSVIITLITLFFVVKFY